MEEYERIRVVRKEFCLTMKEFGERIGLSPSAISMIESGKNAVTNQTRTVICRTFGVKEEWLRTGSGEMFLPKSRAQEVDEIAKAAGTRDPQEAARFLHGLLDGMSDADILSMYDFFLRHFPSGK